MTGKCERKYMAQNSLRLNVGKLRLGMFVSDIDCPWTDTPFLMQGFLVDEEAQIATFRKHCKFVVVDVQRSLPGAVDEAALREDAPRDASGSAPVLFRTVNDAGPEDFFKVCQSLQLESGPRRYTQAPVVSEEDHTSHLEAELLYTAPVVDDIQSSLKSLQDSLANNSEFSFEVVSDRISELACSIERNSDAALWLCRLRSTDEYSYDHAMDVSIHLMAFAHHLGMPPHEVEELGMVGLLQDVGKVDIPVEVLNKHGELTEEEYRLVQSHVASSLEILASRKCFAPQLLEIVASHHERLDGGGYPRQLRGEKIPFKAELSGVVDSYCAMIRNRVYTKAMSSHRALEQLMRMRGVRFRELVVDQFMQFMGLYPVGSLVELSTGEVAVVIQQNKVRRLKPRVMILLAADKSVERYPITIDLMMNPTTPTGRPYSIKQALPSDAYGIDPREFYLA